MSWSPPLGPVFQREHGSTEVEWLGVLPGAVGPHRLTLDPAPPADALPGERHAHVAIGEGGLHLSWQVLPPRRIALVSLPRLAVRYRFHDLEDEARHRFLRYFDLYMQRGGG